MAYIVSVTTSFASASSPQSPAFPTHAIGDLLLVCVSQDGGGTALATSSTGWAFIGTQAASAGARQAWAYKIATGTSGEDPSITGATEEWVFTMYVIRDAHASPFGSLVSGTDFVRTDYTGSAGGTNSGALTTGTDGCLLLYSWCLDAGTTSGAALRVSPNDLFVDSSFGDATSPTIYQLTGHIQQATGAAAPTVKCYVGAVNDGGNGWVISVRNVANGKLQKDCRAGAELIKWYGNFGTGFETLGYNAPSNLTTDTIDGLSPASVAATVSHTASDALYPPGTRTNISSAVSDASDLWVGIAHDISSTSMTGAVFSVDYFLTAVTAPVGAKGFIIVFSDGTNWVAYRVGYPAMTGIAATLYKVQIAIGDSTTYAESAGAIDWGAVTKIGYFYHRSANSVTSRGFEIKNAVLYRTAKLIGGNSVYPAQISYWPDGLTASGLGGVQTLQGSGQTLGKSLLQIGDGSTPTYFDLSAQSFEYPTSYLASNISRANWNAGESSVGVTIYASASDTINCSAGVLATSTKQPFTIHSSSSTSATYSFNGTSFVGWDVAWKTGVTCSGATFKSCYEIDFKGANVTNCTITSTVSADAAAAWSESGATVTNCSIDGTGAAYAIELGTSVTAITLTDCTITAGSTDKVHVLATTGTVTITISGTTSLVAGDVTSEGATVTIAAPELYQSVVVTGFTAGSRLQVYDVDYNFTVTGVTTYPAAGQTYTDPNGVVFTVISSGAGAVHAYGVTSPKLTGTLTLTKTSGGTGDATITYTACSDDGTELFNGTASAGNTVISGSTATWTDNVAASATRYIRLRRSYVTASTASRFFEQIIGTCGITEGTETVTYLDSPVTDESYETNGVDGSGVTTVTFTDAATDLVNCNVPGGSITWQTIYAAFVYWFFTATGIADDIAYAESPDTANYLFTSTKVKNTSTGPVVPLTITGGYGRDAITGLSSDIIDTSGGSIFLAPDHVVAYATGSGALTAGDIASIWSASTRSLTATTNANVVQVGGATVTGSGTESDPWGP